MNADELRAWLKKNRAHFLGYTPDEVAHRAILAGAAVADVCLVLVDWQDCFFGTSLARRAKLGVDLECSELRRNVGIVDLDEQWKALYWKLTTERDFED